MNNSQLPAIKPQGILFVLSSPSGAGKSTIARYLLNQEDLGLLSSVSMTTRKPRLHEIAGVDYKFVSLEEFLSQRDSDSFLEWAEVHGNFYGTPEAPVREALNAGKNMLFDIDWQGAAQLRKKMQHYIVSIFILPPSMRELKRRLKKRSEDADRDIIKRLDNASLEISHWNDYDYVVINNDLDSVCASVRAIVLAECFRRHRLSGLIGFVDSLLLEGSQIS